MRRRSLPVQFPGDGTGPLVERGGREAKGVADGSKQRSRGVRGGAGKRRRDRGRKIAALDLGTNNCRLLIARPTAGGFAVVDGFSRIVRLGQGLEATGILGETAMRRTVDALGVCASKIRHHRVARARYVATEAARRAANCSGFIARVADETGIELDIITSREEARLTLMGCLPLFDRALPYGLIFDVGGGSAEIVWFRLDGDGAPDILGWISLPVGVVTLTERHGPNDFSAEEYEATVAEVVEMLMPFDAEHGIRRRIEQGRTQMLGTAGTVTTISGVSLGLKRYNRALVDGSYLTFDQIRSVSCALSRSTYAERAAHPSIGSGRADLVVAGCAILEAICRTWPAGRLRVADRGVREGILIQLAAEFGAGPADGRA